jgi:predicted transcriptional regulator
LGSTSGGSNSTSQDDDDKQQSNGGVARGLDALYKALEGTHIQECQASVEADRQQILQMIKDGPGYATIDKHVNDQQRSWARGIIEHLMKQKSTEIEDATNNSND